MTSRTHSSPCVCHSPQRLRGSPQTYPSPRTSPSQHQPEFADQNQLSRRLQLRNAGLRGSILPGRRIGSFGSASIADLIPHPIGDENQQHMAEKRTPYGDGHSTSPGSILQEINNTAQRKRHSAKVSICEIWEDSASKENQPSSTVNTGTLVTEKTSSLHSASNSPSRSVRAQKASRNLTGSPTHVNQTKGRRKTLSSQRWANSEQTEYIEHLESELSSLHTKIDALNSPTALRVQSMRVRGLKTQVRLLEYEVAQWERKSEEMVADEAHQYRMMESGLKTRIRKLEDEGNLKDFKIKESERELESAAVKIKEIHSLESTNRSLERRIDILTELLAHSPTRLDFPPSVSSSERHSLVQRTSRPRSVISKMSSSPGELKRRSTYASEMGPWQLGNYDSSSCITEGPDEEPFSPIKDEKLGAEQMHTQLKYSNSSQSGTDDRTSFRSTSSRPTSMTSNSSWGTSWGLSLSGAVEDESGSVTRSRTMRRFPSGSCALKPLVLPAAAVLPCLPMSASVPAKRDVPYREFSHTPSDLHATFLSQEDTNLSFFTPVSVGRRQSASLAQKQALDVLEGKPILVLEGEDPSQNLSDATPDSTTSEDVNRFYNETSPPTRNKRRSLQEELEEVQEFLTITSNKWSSPSCGATDNHSYSPQSIDSNAPSPANATMEDHATSLFGNCLLETPRISNNSLVNPPQCRSESPSAVNSVEEVHVSTPLPAGKVDISTQLNNLICAMKQDPWTLARRIATNAWRRAESKLAGLAWWLLGLLFGPRSHKRIPTANPKVDEGEISHKICCHHTIVPTNRIALSAHQPLQGSLVPCHTLVQPSSRRSLRLWLRFSLAIVLAVGIAIKEGPGRLMSEDSSEPVTVLLQDSELLKEPGDDPKEPNLM
ncbi:hypothetical protein MMC14_003029 [Varicellaria rhodocarpa]|nr:hypothetical protein [Varicellaria rhodocarpa]